MHIISGILKDRDVPGKHLLANQRKNRAAETANT